jgi:hypothetical protein
MGYRRDLDGRDPQQSWLLCSALFVGCLAFFGDYRGLTMTASV